MLWITSQKIRINLATLVILLVNYQQLEKLKLLNIAINTNSNSRGIPSSHYLLIKADLVILTYQIK